MNQSVIVAPTVLEHTNEVSCFAPWYLMGSEYCPEACTYHPLVNGEEAFKAVHMAIAQATKTIDIICWGFQPSMYFIRGKDSKEPRIGDLLILKATEGVKVRVLVWEAILNTAGAAGETNLPGKAVMKGTVRPWPRGLQHTTDEDHEYDRWWFKTFHINNQTTHKPGTQLAPVFTTRGFSMEERDRIADGVKYEALDKDISRKTRWTQWWTPTHHQKSVLVDYERVDGATGFVMGHNMLEEYWDTDAHSAKNRTPETKPAANEGPRGDTPRQDISCQIGGPILRHLHDNFSMAWAKETGEGPYDPRESQEEQPLSQCAPGSNLQVAQILRTQPQYGVRDIEKAYLQAVNNAVRFIYIENQYFRWPHLAELIKEIANSQTAAGRDPGLHGPLHLFVITNDTYDGIGKGAVNTQRMLESLGRADTIPEVTKQRRIQQTRDNLPAEPIRPQRPTDYEDRRAHEQWQAKKDLHDQEILEIERSTIVAQPIPGLKVHICSLVADDSPAGVPWMPVYIHSKLMIIDDVYTSQGSTNINTRSMQVDTELNIAHEWASVTRDLRRRLWNLHTKKMGGQDDPSEAFEQWRRVMSTNDDLRSDGDKPHASLVEFYYDTSTLADQD